MFFFILPNDKTVFVKAQTTLDAYSRRENSYYFGDIILNFLSLKFSCFLMDRAGFLVVHRDWFEAPQSDDDWFSRNVHVAEREPGIARDMISQNIIRKHACVNITGIREQYSWDVSMASIV